MTESQKKEKSVYEKTYDNHKQRKEKQFKKYLSRKKEKITTGKIRELQSLQSLRKAVLPETRIPFEKLLKKDGYLSYSMWKKTESRKQELDRQLKMIEAELKQLVEVENKFLDKIKLYQQKDLE